jgi:hypothetical protein
MQGTTQQDTGAATGAMRAAYAKLQRAKSAYQSIAAMHGEDSRAAMQAGHLAACAYVEYARLRDAR